MGFMFDPSCMAGTATVYYFVTNWETGETPVRSRHCNRLREPDPNAVHHHNNILTERVILQEPRMSTTVATQPDSDLSLPSLPLAEILPWAIFAGLLLLLAIYFVGAEQGATSLISGTYVHEFVHDGRHLLGFPCH
jgi:hypothetical protein